MSLIIYFVVLGRNDLVFFSSRFCHRERKIIAHAA